MGLSSDHLPEAKSDWLVVETFQFFRLVFVQQTNAIGTLSQKFPSLFFHLFDSNNKRLRRFTLFLSTDESVIGWLPSVRGGLVALTLSPPTRYALDCAGLRLSSYSSIGRPSESPARAAACLASPALPPLAIRPIVSTTTTTTTTTTTILTSSCRGEIEQWFPTRGGTSPPPYGVCNARERGEYRPLCGKPLR